METEKRTRHGAALPGTRLERKTCRHKLSSQTNQTDSPPPSQVSRLFLRAQAIPKELQQEATGIQTMHRCRLPETTSGSAARGSAQRAFY